MVKEKFIIDSDTNCLLLAWPSIYRKKIFWRDLIKIYYKLISIIISNGYHIILIHHENVNIENEIEFIGKKFSDINSNYKSNISFHEYDFDDIYNKILESIICFSVSPPNGRSGSQTGILSRGIPILYPVHLPKF